MSSRERRKTRKKKEIGLFFYAQDGPGEKQISQCVFVISRIRRTFRRDLLNEMCNSRSPPLFSGHYLSNCRTSPYIHAHKIVCIKFFNIYISYKSRQIRTRVIKRIGAGGGGSFFIKNCIFCRALRFSIRWAVMIFVENAPMIYDEYRVCHSVKRIRLLDTGNIVYAYIPTHLPLGL